MTATDTDDVWKQYRPTIRQRIRSKLRTVRWRAVEKYRNSLEWLKWIGHKPGNLETYARRELELAGYFKNEGMYGDLLGHAIMRMIRQFSDDGHSGMSGGITLAVFNQIADFNPLTPLTGEPDEWNECSSGVFQNKRCSHVFKDATGAYDIEGRVFREPSGAAFTSRDSRMYVTFPYMPKTEIVDVGAPK